MDDLNELIEAIVNTPDQVETETAINTSDGQIAAQMRQQAVLQLVQHPNADIRQEAAEKLAESPGDAALEALKQLYKDEASEVRQQALASLSSFEQPETLDILAQGLQDSDYVVRATAAEGLGIQKAEAATEALLKALRDEYYMVRATAAEALGRLEAFLAIPGLQDALLDSDQWVRHSAAESLSQIEPEEVLWQTLIALNETDSEAQKQALRKLGEHADPRAVPSLVRCLKDEPELSPEIINALTAIHDPKVVPALVETALFTERAHLREQALIQAQTLSLENTVSALADWLDPETPRYSERAIEALQQMPTHETTPVFNYALQHPNEWVQTVSLITLNNRNTAADPEILKGILKTQSPDLGTAALRNLLHYSPAEALDELQGFLDSEDEWRRNALADNLEHLPPETQLTYARQLLEDEQSEIREAVMKSLSQNQEAEVLPLLIQGSQDEDPWVRQEALSALGQSGAAEAKESLETALRQDPEFLVRAKAVEALIALAPDDLEEILDAALDDEKPSVRIQAVRGILERAGQNLPRDMASRLLHDGERNIQIALLEHLRRHPHEDYKDLIASHCDAEDAQIQSAARAAYEAVS